MNQQQLKTLSKIKKLIKVGKKRFETRLDRDYLKDLLELGITEEEAWDQILNLNSYYYVLDFRPNYKKTGESLIFKKKINGMLAYIKVKIEKEKNDDLVVCLSFHKDKQKEGKL